MKFIPSRGAPCFVTFGGGSTSCIGDQRAGFVGLDSFRTLFEQVRSDAVGGFSRLANVRGAQCPHQRLCTHLRTFSELRHVSSYSTLCGITSAIMAHCTVLIPVSPSIDFSHSFSPRSPLIVRSRTYIERTYSTFTCVGNGAQWQRGEVNKRGRTVNRERATKPNKNKQNR